MIASWMTTNACNLHCTHCYQDAGEPQDTELTTAEAEKMIGEIAGAGFRILIFSGGEPLLRPDIYHLVAHAAAKGLRPVFGTNGTLITAEAAKRLKDAGAAAMGISLDSLREAEHNKFRGHPDAFRLTVRGMENCRAAGLPFQVHTTILDWNKHEIPGIVDFAEARGAVAHQIFFLIPVGRGAQIQKTSLEVMEYERTLQTIMEKTRGARISIKPTCAPQFTRVAAQMGIGTRFARGCLAGLTYCIVGSNGKVRPCAYMVEEAGDVRTQRFGEIWDTSPLFRLLRTEQYKGACSCCDYKGICGGCRARAGYYNGGDIMGEDSYCAYTRELAKEVHA